MTAAELIEELQKLPSDTRLYFDTTSAPVTHISGPWSVVHNNGVVAFSRAFLV
jgi:hypothetical protein